MCLVPYGTITRLAANPQETAEPAPIAGPDALLKDKIKQKRHREGYEEGVSVIHRPTSAASFISAERPVEALGRFTTCGPVVVVGDARRNAATADPPLIASAYYLPCSHV